MLSITDLRVSFPSEAGVVNAVRGVNFELQPGRTLAIVGESGSGKSVTSMAIMGLLPGYADVTGSVQLNGRELIGLSDAEMSKVRGREIGMIFQDPLSALTPVFTVGDQIVEAILAHQKVSRQQAWKQAIELLDLVGIPEPQRRVKSFPHEFSGGMRQRVVIAIAIANNPSVLIADEPTTALDVTIQAQILDLIKVAQKETNAATIMITHDMGVVAGVADDVMVMYAGRPVEYAQVDKLFASPMMPYTIGLLESIPKLDRPSEVLTTIKGNPPIVVNLPDECAFAPRCPIAGPECLAKEPVLRPVPGTNDHHIACVHDLTDRNIYPVPEVASSTLEKLPRDQRETVLEVRDLSKQFPVFKGSLLKRQVGNVQAVNKVSFDIKAGECFAIVGESGSGKTTTLLEIMELAPSDGSTVILGGKNTAEFSRAARKAARKDIQIVFQDPMGALDPRMTISEILKEPLVALGYKGNHDDRVSELMELVGLNPAHIDRFPGHFSGGQRQRINVARALAAKPKLIVLDEPVSALDVSIQAGLLNLLADLKAKLGVSYLFVAHDLSVIRHISDRVAVMYRGSFVEQGTTQALFDDPRHPYTQALLSAIPLADPALERSRERIILTETTVKATGAATDTEAGCPFISRCPLHQTLAPDEQAVCQRPVPMHQVQDQDQFVACHHR
ncbi:dipeptide ABC transporter ATP-binding protein [Corynebacterium epidermidicanis]|uniref:Oligopeptide/dipeptide ABC transporter, ATP-binding protein n=1 Tax=Corynebacterium epidermidicanis TaxID=1050174 RepID=A0A0G3GV74_9CORY|nr:ABC transporter ATP-binding protein [Corynebacterium epidermidicanis]AKK03433.1 oligopeptide/dipeptide ABC transporter, ATP-binding protein [Corynebacterium epidermidicanis]